MADLPLDYRRFEPWQRLVETGLFILVALIDTISNSLTVTMEAVRRQAGFGAAESLIWESTSTLAVLLLLPAVVELTRRAPLQWRGLSRRLPVYLFASLIWSLLHVVIMVGLRKLAYGAVSDSYDFGHWPRELLYEYLKDFRTFAGFVLIIHVWRWFVLRWQGEASVLADGDEDSAEPVAPVSPDAVSAAPADVATPSRPDRFLIRKLGREFLIAAADIERVQASGNYVNLHVRGRVYPLRSTMAEFEAQLDPAAFRRVHRSHIVHLDQIESIEPFDTGDARAHLRDASVVPVSRNYRQNLRTAAVE